MTTYEDRRFYDLADLEGEEWKDVEGFEGLYKVSSLGRIKSVGRIVNGRWGDYKVREKVLAGGVNKSGYINILLYKDGVRINSAPHRLTAFAFIPNPENKPEVNHKDGNKLNNFSSNLEWSTSKENMLHAYSSGLTRRGIDSYMSKLDEWQVRMIKYEHNEMTHQAVADLYDISRSAVCHIRKSRAWKHV